jgi:outer membrane protein assembly factor BamB
MRRGVGFALVALLAALFTGCDSPFVRFGAERSGWNLGEPTRSASEVAAFDEAWAVDLGGEPTDPVVAGGTAYVSWRGVAGQSTGGVVALDLADGDERWSYAVPTGSSSPPAFLTAPGVAGGEVYVGVQNQALSQVTGTVLALDAATGGTGRVVSDEPGTASPIRVGKVVYAPWLLELGSAGVRTSGVQGVTVDTGEVTFGALGRAGAAAVSGDRLYAVIDDQLRAFSLTDTSRCEVVSTFPVGNDTTLNCAPLWSAPAPQGTIPAVQGGAVYIGGGDGLLRAFDADGCAAATCAPLWTGATGGPIRTGAAVDGVTVVVGSDDGKVHAFRATGCGAATCPATWTGTPGGGAVRSSPTLASGFAFVGSESGQVRAYPAAGCGAATCASVWSEATGAAVRTSPAVADGNVVVTDVAGGVHVYRAPSA